MPVGNWEEDWARAYPNIFVEPIDPASHYPCCSARGSLVAMDVNTGKILWKRHTNIGNDPDHELAPELRALLGPKGSFGTSTYGHNPTVDVARRQVYIAMAQTTTAPQVAQDCEQARRRTGDPNANIPGLPAGVTCNNLNEKLHIYANAMIAVDMDTGRVNWAFYAHKYDAWNHACGAPDLYGWSTVVPALFPVPLANGIANCTQTPIGPDMGFGQQPKLVKNVKLAGGKRGDVVVGGNKDGRLFGLDPATGKKIWETNVDPGGVYGGLQFGIATDDGKVFFGTTNSRNNGRNIKTPYVPVTRFLDINGFTALGLKTGPFVKRDAALPSEYPSPSNIDLPFPGPNIIYGINEYPNVFPDPDGIVRPAELHERSRQRPGRALDAGESAVRCERRWRQRVQQSRQPPDDRRHGACRRRRHGRDPVAAACVRRNQGHDRHRPGLRHAHRRQRRRLHRLPGRQGNHGRAGRRLREEAVRVS